jgi:hypothetical protein
MLFFSWIASRVEQAVYQGLANAAAKIDSGDVPDAFADLQARLALPVAKDADADVPASRRSKAKA